MAIMLSLVVSKHLLNPQFLKNISVENIFAEKKVNKQEH